MVVLKDRLSSKEISYREDIAREVSEATGMEYELCLELQKGIFQFVVEETQEESNYSINLPWLGILYLSKVLSNHTRINLHTVAKAGSPERVEKLNFWERRISAMKEYKEKNSLGYQSCKHFTLPFTSKFKVMLPENYKAKHFLSGAKSPEIYAAVEELQNIGYYEDLERIKGKNNKQ